MATETIVRTTCDVCGKTIEDKNGITIAAPLPETPNNTMNGCTVYMTIQGVRKHPHGVMQHIDICTTCRAIVLMEWSQKILGISQDQP